MLKHSLLIAMVSMSVFAAEVDYLSDKDYQDGMAYLNGDKGVVMVTKIMPNCPYEKCADIVSKDGTHTFSYPKKDLARAVDSFYKSVKKKNPKSAKMLVDMLQRRLNWKEPKADGYLTSRLQEDLNVDLPTYKKYFKDSVSVLVSHNVCDGFVTEGDMFSNGYLGTQIDTSKAKDLYTKALSACQKDSYFGILAGQKLKNISQP